ncbi:IS701 family transposase [Streptosporangium sp. NPDC006013]|uniref:IS701 family transposase n=1 Tax=Streptosporangium sp. NPDC006013 TaxID=3155596 RepID=UPI0033BCDC89
MSRLSLRRELADLLERVGKELFVRTEPRTTFKDLVQALLGEVPRKNSWQLAECAGHPTAHRIEWLLSGAKWDADRLRDIVYSYVMDHLAADRGLFIIQELQILKKGDRSVGVARQGCGDRGPTQNCQVAVMLAYASFGVRPFVDRELYLPRFWAEDSVRCRRAGVPMPPGAHRTKPELVAEMLTRAIDSRTPFSYVVGGATYGTDPRLRKMLHDRGVSYVMAIPPDFLPDAPVVSAAGSFQRSRGKASPQTLQFIQCENGDRVSFASSPFPRESRAEGYVHGVLSVQVGRSAGDRYCFLVHCRKETPVAELASAAAAHLASEHPENGSSDLSGLDQYQVRKWVPWYRHVTTCMLASAFSAVCASSRNENRPEHRQAV